MGTRTKEIETIRSFAAAQVDAPYHLFKLKGSVLSQTLLPFFHPNSNFLILFQVHDAPFFSFEIEIKSSINLFTDLLFYSIAAILI